MEVNIRTAVHPNCIFVHVRAAATSTLQINQRTDNIAQQPKWLCETEATTMGKS